MKLPFLKLIEQGAKEIPVGALAREVEAVSMEQMTKEAMAVPMTPKALISGEVQQAVQKSDVQATVNKATLLQQDALVKAQETVYLGEQLEKLGDLTATDEILKAGYEFLDTSYSAKTVRGEMMRTGTFASKVPAVERGNTLQTKLESVFENNPSLPKQEIAEVFKDVILEKPQSANALAEIVAASPKGINPIKLALEWQQGINVAGLKTQIFDWGSTLIMNFGTQPAARAIGAGVGTIRQAFSKQAIDRVHFDEVGGMFSSLFFQMRNGLQATYDGIKRGARYAEPPRILTGKRPSVVRKTFAPVARQMDWVNVLNQQRLGSRVHQRQWSSENFQVAKESFVGRLVDGIGSFSGTAPSLMATKDDMAKAVIYPAEIANELRRMVSTGLIEEANFDKALADTLAIRRWDDYAISKQDYEDLLQQAFPFGKEEYLRVQGAHRRAANYTKRVTWTADPGVIEKSVVQLLDKTLWGIPRFLAPYINTPAQILDYTLNTLPGVGFLTKRGSDALRVGGSQLDHYLGEMAVTTSLMGIGALAAKAGYLTTASGTNFSADRAKRGLGILPHAIKIGDTYINLDRLEPFTTHLTLLADAMYIYDTLQGDIPEGVEDAMFHRMTLAMMGITDMLLDKTYFTGIYGVTSALMDRDERAFKQAMLRVGASMASPSFMREIANTFDPTIRLGDDLLGQVLADYGFSSVRRRDQLGRVLKRPEGFLFQMSTVKDDPILQEIVNSGAEIRLPGRRLKGVELSLPKWDELLARCEEEITPALSRRLARSEYNKAPATLSAGEARSTKAQIIQSEYSKAVKTATNRFLKDNPEIEVQIDELENVRQQTPKANFFDRLGLKMQGKQPSFEE